MYIQLQNLFSVQELNREWTFEDEVAKTKTLFEGRRNYNYDPLAFEGPGNVDDEYFPTMRRGRTIHSMQEAEELLKELHELPSLTQPALTSDIWEV